MSKDAVDIMNELFANDKFEWVGVDLDALPNNTRIYLEKFVLFFGYTVKVHNDTIEGQYVFSIEHPTVKYLIHDPEGDADPEGLFTHVPQGMKDKMDIQEKGSHMWGDANFDNIEGNLALASLAAPDGGAELLKKNLDHIDDFWRNTRN